MEVPPVVLRERLWCKLHSNPRLKSYVGGNRKLRPVDGVCIGIVGVKPIEMTVRKEWATGAAMNDESAANQGGMAECFSADHWKRTLVASMTFFIQNCTGMGWVIGYMSYFMQLAGMPAAQVKISSRHPQRQLPGLF